MREQVEDLVGKLREEGKLTSERLLHILPEMWGKAIYQQDQPWSVHDVIAHLVAAERGHQRIIGSVASGGAGAPVGLDIDGFNAESVRELSECTPGQLLSDFSAARAATITLVGGLEDVDLQRRGRHPVLGENALLVDMVRLILLHVRMHVRDLQRGLG